MYNYCMERFLYQDLVNWKNQKDHKPLILEGARQVGKTWLLKQFGKNEFENFVYINCDNNPQIEDVFIDYDVERIIRNLSAISNIKIESEKTLIILDEIQQSPKALTSLKYFNEQVPQLHVAVAGSLLGLMEHYGSGFPVGKVETLNLYPLSFMEFLLAMKKGILVSQIMNHNWAEMNSIITQLTELLRQYYFVGGMPAVVLDYVQKNDIQKVRALQNQIIQDYQKDISKHASKRDIPKINMVWNSIPSQLAKENKKFIYGAIKSGSRAKDFENAIQWLIDAGLVHKVHRVKKIQMPLKFYEDLDCFKLFVNDLGLLGAMVEAPASEILVGNNSFTSYKGSFTEQFVAQQYLSARRKSANTSNLYYYTNDNSTMEIDFVIQTEKVYPIEVKAEENLKSKSLSTVLKENDDLTGIRFSMANYKQQEKIVNVPLAMAEEYIRGLL